MAKKQTSDANIVSMGYWMFIACFPLLNLVAIPILALVSKNPSKKNFYKAILMFVLLFVALQVSAMVIVMGPDFLTVIGDYIKSAFEGL
ncbi:MAG: hypothetical protein ACPG32_01445 [Akkermansiaceae bacterium]